MQLDTARNLGLGRVMMGKSIFLIFVNLGTRQDYFGPFMKLLPMNHKTEITFLFDHKGELKDKCLSNCR